MKVSIEGHEYDYDPNKMLNTEAIALQKVTGMRMKEWAAALAEGDPYAMTGLVWLLHRREGNELPFDEVEFDMGTIAINDDDEEPDGAAGPTPAPEPVEAGSPT